MKQQAFRFPLSKTSTLVLVLLLCLPDFVFAQHTLHMRRNTIDLPNESLPADDQVLRTSPDNLILRFGDYVRLVKLTLKATDENFSEKPIDLGFQYNPNPNRVFITAVPELPKAQYYTADWAVLDTNNTIVYGTICFAVGPDAVTPSLIIPPEEAHFMAPDYRLLEFNLGQ
ncbi:MAG: copper resistance protein CopC [Pseudomonadales bacterium]|nr:copper resistance protein CopC [Pseudomonadales bacterium]